MHKSTVVTAVVHQLHLP